MFHNVHTYLIIEYCAHNYIVTFYGFIEILLAPQKWNRNEQSDDLLDKTASVPLMSEKVKASFIIESEKQLINKEADNLEPDKHEGKENHLQNLKRKFSVLLIYTMCF